MRTRNYTLPAALGGLLLVFWISPDLQVIAAGVAVFLFGMRMLEDGFKLAGSGMLERWLEKATRSIFHAFDHAATTV